MIYNVLQYLEKSAEYYPEKVALEDEAEKITYREYMDAAKQIGTYLSKRLDGKTGLPVIVLIDRNICSIVTFMGIVYSGNFYVPVDFSMPKERIELIYDTLKPLLKIDACNRREKDAETINYTDIVGHIEVDQSRLDEIRRNSIDTDPLYAIFTSGSTGVPKGVLVSHRSVIDLVNAFEEAFYFETGAIFGNQAPFDFDVSVKDIYNSLYVSGRVQILAKKLFKMPKLLIDYLNEKKVNTLIWAVSALRIVAYFKALDEIESLVLRNIMFSGEIMPIKVLNYWMVHLPDARYVNLYGPTEITCNCTYYEVKERCQEDGILPIGKAFANSRVLLRDCQGHFIEEKNLIGEICVTGSCLALGYWNDREKTQEVFIENSQIPEYTSKMYATGDMGYFNEEGNLVFVSRKDYQIKHMGHRIELGEIETVLNTFSFLEISCCLYDKKNSKIVCFYQAERVYEKEIIIELSKKLPKYMCPNVYIHYDSLPMNRNGKIDRKVLGDILNG